MLKRVFSLFFPSFFCVRQEKKILGKFGGFPWLKQSNQGKEGQGCNLEALSSHLCAVRGKGGPAFDQILTLVLSLTELGLC